MNTAVYARSRGSLWRRTSSRVLVISGDEVHELGGSSVLIWEGLRIPSTLEDLLAGLALRFEDPAAEMPDEVEALLRRLEEFGVVEVRR